MAGSRLTASMSWSSPDRASLFLERSAIPRLFGVRLAIFLVAPSRPKKVSLMPLDFSSLDLSVVELHSPANRIEPNDHFVEFYENDRSVISSIRTFVSMGISEGDAVVIVATPEHRAALDEALGWVVDLPRAREKGLYTTLDAEETLSRLMSNGRPDPDKFIEVIGGAIDQARRAGKKVRLFGEMVAILWGQGNEGGALELEGLWNRLAQEKSFRLFCAYSSDLFTGNDLDLVGAVVHQHSHIVLPKEAAV
jgi:hypothetical protein